jgi:hypothetical protein
VITNSEVEITSPAKIGLFQPTKWPPEAPSAGK